jgi:hypothetical protein
MEVRKLGSSEVRKLGSSDAQLKLRATDAEKFRSINLGTRSAELQLRVRTPQLPSFRASGLPTTYLASVNVTSIRITSPLTGSVADAYCIV